MKLFTGILLTSVLLTGNLFTSNLYSQDIQNVQIGELVKFEAPEAESYKWFADLNTKDFLSYNGDKNAVFSGRSPGTYKFFCAYYSQGKIDLKVFIVNVIGPPTEPKDTSALDKWIPYWLGSMNLPKDQAELLAQAFDKTALRITAGMTGEQIIPIMTEETKKALGENITQWIPLLTKLKTICENKAKEGKLSTPADHIALFQEISKGLRIYK